MTEGAGGSVTEDGIYTAPTTRGTYHLVARVAVFPAASTTVVVNVQ